MQSIYAFSRLGSTVNAKPSTSSCTPQLPFERRHGLQKRSSNVASRTLAPDRSHLFSVTPSADLEILQQRLAAHLDTTASDTRTPPVDRAELLGWLSPRARNPRKRLASPVSFPEDEYHPSQGWKPRPHHLSKQQLWERIRVESQQDAASEPTLASFLYSTVLSHNSLEKTLGFLLANKLANGTTLGAVQVMKLCQDAYDDDPSIVDAAVADMLAVKDRDPACEKFAQCMLYFKGFQAVQSHRVCHWLWGNGRRSLALALASRASEVFHVDIHPAAQLGIGILLDHATGVVIGETAIVGDNVSMLHHVSLGGSGTSNDVRHPTVGHGVLLGAGATLLGPIVVGAGSKIGAGSLVVSDLPAHCVAVGVPAKIVKRDLLREPVQDMDQCADFILDYVI
eukprot:CAMPEP_0202889850 /NCGR_PEP_ID=MMETSP1392-20130828/408_1 /ASSEMBLY_ACC=CAM_ASM_000868 /TAXON_ID=225041 /ORGANISM="Chlamydomonas chlamydogama, Strain SAG 11-48b" /LENGTH=395 /DNA_ID=CAMNT_0049573279 /DNA_START=260 /DNA_END=1447 /DNA_ORIENTATION=+